MNGFGALFVLPRFGPGWLAVGHPVSLDGVVLWARMRFSIYGRYAPARSIGGVCEC